MTEVAEVRKTRVTLDFAKAIDAHTFKELITSAAATHGISGVHIELADTVADKIARKERHYLTSLVNRLKRREHMQYIRGYFVGKLVVVYHMHEVEAHAWVNNLMERAHVFAGMKKAQDAEQSNQPLAQDNTK
jgi:hypothetical protein